jgi:hypothetical protein
MRTRTRIVAAALAAAAVTATAAPAVASPAPPEEIEWTWFAIFSPNNPDDRKGVELASCLSAADPLTCTSALVFEALRQEEPPPDGTCVRTKLPDQPAPAIRVDPWWPEVDQVRLNNLNGLRDVRAVVGLCRDGSNVLGVQVPIQHIANGLNTPILRPGNPDDSGVPPQGCATDNGQVSLPKP